MISSKKRKFAEADGLDDAKKKEINSTTAAADFNRRVIKKLQNALAKDPEVSSLPFRIQFAPRSQKDLVRHVDCSYVYPTSLMLGRNPTTFRITSLGINEL